MYPNLWRHNGRIVGFRHFGHNALHNGRSGLYGGSGSPGEDTPSFDLPLANMSSGVFTIAPRTALGSSTPTYTRATAATTIDFEGLLKTCLSGEVRCLGGRRVRNLVTGNSTTLAGFSVDGSATATGGQSDPSGGTSAIKVVSGGSASGLYLATSPPAGTVTSSVWLRGEVGGEVVQLGQASLTVTLTTSWVRYSKTEAQSSVYMFVRGNTAGYTFYAYQAQQESVTGQSNQNPSEYVSTGGLSAPTYHGVGVDGVKVFTTLNGNTVASNVVTEATGAAITSAQGACAGGVTAGVVDAVGPVGYLAEGARTQRCLHSQAFSNAVWVSGGGGIAVTDNSFVAPDGTTTADTLTASGANGTLIQDLGTVASAAKAGGLWLYRKTGTGNIDLTLDGGSTWTTKAITAAWTRVQISQTLADEDFGIRIVTSGDEVYAWQGQVETGAFLSSDITSTTVAVARNADVLTYVATSNMPASGQPETWFCEVTRNNTGQEAGGILGGNQDFRVLLVQSEAGGSKGYTYHDAAATGPALTAAGITSNTATKLAFVYNGSTVTTYKDGTAGTPVAMGAQGSNATVLVVGALANGTAPLFAAIRSIKIIPRALSTAQVAAL